MSESQEQESIYAEVQAAKKALLAGIEGMSPRLAAELQRKVEHLERISTNGSNSDRTIRQAIRSALIQREGAIKLDEMSAGVFRDLAEAGYDPPSLEWLSNRRYGDLGAAPILLDWYDKIDDVDFRHVLLRAFGGWAFPTLIPALFDRFDRIDPAVDPAHGVRDWLLGTMAGHIRSVDRHRWAAIAADPAQADIRYRALEGLSNLRKKPDDLVEFVEGLLEPSDRLTAIGAAQALGRWKVVEALPRIEQVRAEIVAEDAALPENDRDGWTVLQFDDVIKKLRTLQVHPEP